jgi:hypothetical protein
MKPSNISFSSGGYFLEGAGLGFSQSPESARSR